MYGAVFLNIATIFDYDCTPVATNGGTRTNVYIFADNYIAGYSGLRMNK